MNIYFGTVIRAAPVSEGGSLYKLNWDRKEITREVPIAPTEPRLDHDPNARGNVRGVRGICVHNDEVFVADYHTINVFDRDLKLKRKLSHGLMVGLHETQIAEGELGQPILHTPEIQKQQEARFSHATLHQQPFAL